MPTDNDFDLRNITAAIRNPVTEEYETIHITPADVGEVTINPEYGNIAISADEYPPYLTINQNNEAFSQDLMDLVSRVGNNRHWYDDRPDMIRFVPGEVVNVSQAEWATINAITDIRVNAEDVNRNGDLLDVVRYATGNPFVGADVADNADGYAVRTVYATHPATGEPVMSVDIVEPIPEDNNQEPDADPSSEEELFAFLTECGVIKEAV